MIVLTHAPDDRHRQREQVNGLMRRLRERGYDFEMIWTAEPNPKGTGIHIHGLQKGSYVPQDELQTAWGGRVVDIRRVHNVSGAADYLLKEALEKREGQRHRPVTWSRGFFER